MTARACGLIEWCQQAETLRLLETQLSAPTSSTEMARFMTARRTRARAPDGERERC
jgi:hypothetical protein